MGINKPDVRFVFHHTLPKSLEAYYQESGRAGRDNEPATCILWYQAGDKVKVERLIESEENDVRPQIRARLKEKLRCVVNYCENEVDCRRSLQLTYLGEKFDRALCNNTCDNCKNGKFKLPTENVTPLAIKMTNLARELSQSSKVTRIQLVDAFCGASKKNLSRFQSATYFGAGKGTDRVDVDRLAAELIRQQVLVEKIQKNIKGFSAAYISVDENKASQLANSTISVLLTWQQKIPVSTPSRNKKQQHKMDEDNTNNKNQTNNGGQSVDWALFGILTSLTKQVKTKYELIQLL